MAYLLALESKWIKSITAIPISATITGKSMGHRFSQNFFIGLTILETKGESSRLSSFSI